MSRSVSKANRVLAIFLKKCWEPFSRFVVLVISFEKLFQWLKNSVKLSVCDDNNVEDDGDRHTSVREKLFNLKLIIESKRKQVVRKYLIELQQGSFREVWCIVRFSIENFHQSNDHFKKLRKMKKSFLEKCKNCLFSVRIEKLCFLFFIKCSSISVLHFHLFCQNEFVTIYNCLPKLVHFYVFSQFSFLVQSSEYKTIFSTTGVLLR